MAKVLCYNKGCGKDFDPSSSSDEATCLFHDGTPVFHEGLKYWSCCPNKRHSDFGEFLNAPGCTRGKHTNVKPAAPAGQPAAAAAQTTPKAQIVVPTPTPPPVSAPEPWVKSTQPLERLKLVVTDAVRAAGAPAAAAAPSANVAAAGANGESAAVQGSAESKVAVGTICVNNACGKSYTGVESLTEPCLHHTGSPVFHEGSKFWSCCKKRTQDFDEFLAQKGCTTATHCWVKSKVAQQVKCRYDWFAMGGSISLNVYAKKVDCDVSYAEANATTLKVHIIFDSVNEFDLEIDLAGKINPAGSEMQVLGSKVEIRLQKADGNAWQSLERKQ
ncbi:cysteine and histidine-rich domain-containing protein 1 [Capsaspora owczarzaki ATCC 30864]|uniref:Cysteine and histidine-rich domain-containing protein 1 n=1 Tax=Capsaspora owczarzaki (strain ATCC 30864) TaxID=595528 RepID=A0A0D2WQ36_CAPO3|nr:cysteine and histidine-rich domain-containing protein 1 [Capsaspora owczarzaki ATCC 30864]KJE92988.1 cysteine and histidine-rich domain-containing protein 1 [Capsaspora owczarzaki ATCC 30864]|eukprot:XP_004363584.2 cysteine and histidine-rich domain-containing protein 1 [Capsaspora owczarzaki ATCC 30864]